MDGCREWRIPTLGACCPTGTWGPRRDFMAKRMIWRFTKMKSSTKTCGVPAGRGSGVGRRRGLTASPCPPHHPQRAQSSQLSALGAPGTSRSAPCPPHLHRACPSRPLPAPPTPRALQPHEGPEPYSEGLPTDSPGRVSREPFRPLRPGPTAAPRTRQDQPRGGSTDYACCGPADTPGRQPVPPRPARAHQAAVSHDQHHVDPREPIAAGPRHARPGPGPHNMAATKPPCAPTT